jgi:hypothetical protein
MYRRCEVRKAMKSFGSRLLYHGRPSGYRLMLDAEIECIIAINGEDKIVREYECIRGRLKVTFSLEYALALAAIEPYSITRYPMCPTIVRTIRTIPFNILIVELPH